MIDFFASLDDQVILRILSFCFPKPGLMYTATFTVFGPIMWTCKWWAIIIMFVFIIV